MPGPLDPDFAGRLERLDSHQHKREMLLSAERSALIARGRRSVLRTIMLICAVVLLMKGLMLFYIGQVSYEGRLEAMLGGSGIERMAAFVMQPDMLSVWIAQQLQAIFSVF